MLNLRVDGSWWVVEPEDAAFAFAGADEGEVSGGEELGGGFGEGRLVLVCGFLFCGGTLRGC
jgi:hypothetical protein